MTSRSLTTAGATLVTLLCLAGVTWGSTLDFTADQSNDGLSLRCSILNTNEGDADQDLAWLNIISISMEDEQVASMSDHFGAKSYGAEGDKPTVTGSLDGTQKERGFLQASWNTSGSSRTGKYKCQVIGFTSTGLSFTLTETLEVKGEKTVDLVAYTQLEDSIDELKNITENQSAIIAELTKTTENQAKELMRINAELTKTTENQAKELTRINENQTKELTRINTELTKTSENQAKELTRINENIFELTGMTKNQSAIIAETTGNQAEEITRINENQAEIMEITKNQAVSIAELKKATTKGQHPNNTTATRLISEFKALKTTVENNSAAVGKLKTATEKHLSSLNKLSKTTTGHSTIFTALEESKVKLQQEVAKLTSRQDTQVFFTVGMSRDLQVTFNDVVKFDKVITQLIQVPQVDKPTPKTGGKVHGGYNPSTGVFTCPVAGYYQFQATVVDKDVNLSLRHNGVGVVSMLAWHQMVFQTGSNMAVLSLAKGDKITVVADYNTQLIGSTFPLTTFSGMLVYLH